VKGRPRQFRPTLPRLRDRLLIILFGVFTLAGTAGWAREGNAGPAIAFLGMTLAATWLYYRNRIIGSPRLDVDRQGLSYVRGKQSTTAKWSEIARIEREFYRDEIRFIKRDGGRPIIVNSDMATATGERFDMLIEDYWKPPTNSSR